MKNIKSLSLISHLDIAPNPYFHSSEKEILLMSVWHYMRETGQNCNVIKGVRYASSRIIS